MKKLVSLLGMIGAGKTSQGKMLEKLGVKYICTGDLLRREIENETPFGLEYKIPITRGEFAPSHITNKLIFDEIYLNSNIEEPIFVLDGFPRNEDQLNFSINNLDIDCCIYLELSNIDIIKERLMNARKRVDDTEDVILKRVELFNTISLPVIEHYRKLNKLFVIDASKTKEQINIEIRRILGI